MLLHGRWSMLFCGRKDETSIFIANVTFSAEYVTVPLTNDIMVASCLLSEILQQGSCVTDVMNYVYNIEWANALVPPTPFQGGGRSAHRLFELDDWSICLVGFEGLAGQSWIP